MKIIEDLRLKLTTGKEKEVYQRILHRPTLTEPYKFLARLLEKEGDLVQAEAVLRLARSRFPGDRLVREQLADLYEKMKKKARAIDIYRELIREGKSWSAYTRLVRIYKNSGKLEEAVKLLQRVPSSSPFKERTYPALFNLFFVMGDHRRGIRNLEEAIRRFGPNHRYVKDLGRLHMKAGLKREAIGYLRRSLKYQRDDLDAVKWIGLAYLDLGEYGMARRTFLRILEEDPGSYQAMIQLAELCLLQERLDEAKKWLDGIRRIQKRKGEPWDSRSKLAMGEYYLKKGSYRKAVEMTRDGLSETPFYYPMELVHAHSLLKEAYRELGDEFRADLHGLIQQALAENPDPFSALMGLARSLEKKKDLALAKEVLEQLLVTFPGNILILVNLAEAQFERGMTESAVHLARAAQAASAGSFLQDKIKALELLARISRAKGEAGAARVYERQAEKIRNES
jgi:tetratricopeptide (TPR) repeat protein